MKSKNLYANASLTPSQTEAVEKIKEFLLNDELELILTSGPGCGKSFLCGYIANVVFPAYKKTCDLINKTPYRNIYITATTNKAAEVLSQATKCEVSTIHSLLGLVIQEDFDTGEVKLKRAKKSGWEVTDSIFNNFIIIDEASMINEELYRFIQQGTLNCKILYVGDKDQLAPVKSTNKVPFIFTRNIKEVTLTHLVRNKGNQPLIDLCEAYRKCVREGKFPSLGSNQVEVIHAVSVEDQKKYLEEYKEYSKDRRILAYTNKRVIQYNEYLRNLRNEDRLVVGNLYTSGSNYNHNKKFNVHSEDVLELLSVGPLEDHTLCEREQPIKGNFCDFKVNGFHTIRRVFVPEDYDDIRVWTKHFAKQKRWYPYFMYKNTLDVRPFTATTIHKSQGSTYDEVIVDLEDLSRCTVKETAARLLYVAVSRAKKRVIFFNNLKPAYGEIL